MDEGRRSLYAQLGETQQIAVRGGCCFAAIHPARPEVGAIGAWEGDQRPLRAAEAWLRERGCAVAQGPMELSTWFPYRAAEGPWEQAPFFGEPVEPIGRWREAGYREVGWYSSALAPHRLVADRGRALGRALRAEGWTLSSPGVGADGRIGEAAYREAVALLHQLSHAAFAQARAFAPLPEPALQAWYAPLRPLVRAPLVWVARAPDGAVGGFSLGLPDPGTRRFLLKTLAVLPAHRRIGVGAWLVGHTHEQAAALGFSAGVHCLMADESHSRAISRYGGRVFRRYALLERGL
ncbi:MAG: GNAT family N-acetyltransferase [Deltaproteobacteria bacterium]|nr:GNAT family N-acetyltransferase [Deltaproteobacteria bacterium]